jgi:hypothetical protein
MTVAISGTLLRLAVPRRKSELEICALTHDLKRGRLLIPGDSGLTLNTAVLLNGPLSAKNGFSKAWQSKKNNPQEEQKALNAERSGPAGHSSRLTWLSLVGLLPSRAQLRFTRQTSSLIQTRRLSKPAGAPPGSTASKPAGAPPGSTKPHRPLYPLDQPVQSM